MITSKEVRLSPDKTLSSWPPIRLGLLGLNFGEHIGTRIVESVDCLKIIGVCELDQEKLHRVAKGLGVKAYSGLDDMLADPEIEAVAVFTGSPGRAKLISKIINQKRHVLTTKPFELELSEATSVLREANDQNIVVHLNSPGPEAADDTALIQTWIAEHRLGRPIGFHARTSASYREKANGSWYDDPDKCAGAPILRLGVYFLNEFAPLMGKPVKVHVVQSRIFTERPTADNAHLTIEFENGAIGSIFSSFCVEDGRSWRDEITLNFERGTINRWVERHDEGDMGGDFAVAELYRKSAPVIRAQTRPGAFAGWYQWKAFQRAIRDCEGTSGKYAHDILYGVRLLEAMRFSARSGKPQLIKA